MIALVLLVSLLAYVGGDDIGQHIVSGDVASPHTYPWQLSLQRSGSHICGAVLISSNYAITAAHCVSASLISQYTVSCGAHNIHQSESTRQTVSLSALTIHPDYNANGQRPAFPNDIAVLKLSSSVALNSYCQVASLAQGSYDFGGDSGMITGWGRLSGGGTLPSTLREGPISVLTTSDCNSRWGSTVSSTIHICVLDSDTAKYGACNGDSGGPAQVGNTVVGLASFVASGCLVQYPSVYVRVSNYYNWIWNTANSM